MLVLQWGYSPSEAIYIYGCQIDSWNNEIIYNQKHDLFGIRTKITLSGFSIIKPDNDHLTYGKRVAPTDFQPKKYFRLYFAHESEPNNQRTLLEVFPISIYPPPQNSLVDIDNGPVIESIDYEEVTGNFYRWKLTIRTTISHCPVPNYYESDFNVSGTMTISVNESLDDAFYLTKTYRLNCDLRYLVKDKDLIVKVLNRLVRHVYIPLEPGFRRDKIDIQIDDNNYRFSVTYVDKQASDAPPFPISRWEVIHEETSDDFVTWDSTVRATITLPPGVPRKYGLLRFVQLVSNRLKITTNQYGMLEISRAFIPVKATFASHHGSVNKIECLITLRRVSQTGLKDLFGNIFGQWGEEIELPTLPEELAGSNQREHRHYEHMQPQLWGYSAIQAAVRSPVWSAVLMSVTQGCSLPVLASPSQYQTSDTTTTVPTYYATTLPHANPNNWYISVVFSPDINWENFTPPHSMLAVYSHLSGMVEYYQENFVYQYRTLGSFFGEHLIVRTGTPKTRLHYIVDLECHNDYPRLPNPKHQIKFQGSFHGSSVEVNGYLSKFDIKIAAPHTNLDGTSAQRAKVEVVYELDRPLELLRYLELPILPIFYASKDPLVFDLSKLDSRLALGTDERRAWLYT